MEDLPRVKKCTHILFGIGGAFNSAYTLHRGDGASSVASHYSESGQRGGGGGGGESLVSGRQSRSSTTSPPSQSSLATGRQRAHTAEPDQRSTDTFRYVYDYQPNIAETNAK